MSLPSKVLIANRGEIAVRVIRTLRRLGISSVVVYHELDRGSLAVAEADEAVQIFGDPPVSAYLDKRSIIEACEATGAEAVHPGYGFLSENATFAETVADAGICFIGPPPDAIRAMGDKIQSKLLADQAGVPILPGSNGAVADVHAVLKEAERIGYPVLLKASAGGGGKGMRIARGERQCREAFERAAGEARSSFGDDRIFVERYIDRPRHIEMQILADSHGNVVHLGERECSIQRRYQKVIEESPSPVVDDELREAMGRQACALAQEVGYRSAGTVEMIMDEERNFYFLEMNTRLQVEHPVTEIVTGIDIVEQQLRIAAGEMLSFEQKDIQLTGSAIEARIYAEDAAAGYLPAAGLLRKVRFPAGPGLRVDRGVREGQEIGTAFDPMIAKLVGFGGNRDEAIERLREGLRDTVLLGTTTNTAFLERVIAHPAFRAGETHTGFLDQFPDVVAEPIPDHDQMLLLIAAAASHSPRFERRDDVADVLAAIGSWRP